MRYYWAEQPPVFSFNLLVGFAEVLIIGTIAWGICAWRSRRD